MLLVGPGGASNHRPQLSSPFPGRWVSRGFDLQSSSGRLQPTRAMRPGAGGWHHLLLTVSTALMLSMKPPGSWEARIIGGREVTPHSRPYMASVSFDGQHHCGGFLLHARWVVSAAHCFSDRDPRTVLVVLGAHALCTSEPTQQVFSISAVIRHPDFQPTTHANDICLLQHSCHLLAAPAHLLLHHCSLPPVDLRTGLLILFTTTYSTQQVLNVQAERGCILSNHPWQLPPRHPKFNYSTPAEQVCHPGSCSGAAEAAKEGQQATQGWSTVPGGWLGLCVQL
ncbi:serine protease 57 isoform X4 [Saccopteryx bilineata]|uniref:serine protease 57 isoform X4 n=1 Tax=Saccopteryx bilineata TaxID=59482 RepID=UPI0033902BAD